MLKTTPVGHCHTCMYRYNHAAGTLYHHRCARSCIEILLTGGAYREIDSLRVIRNCPQFKPKRFKV